MLHHEINIIQQQVTLNFLWKSVAFIVIYMDILWFLQSIVIIRFEMNFWVPKYWILTKCQITQNFEVFFVDPVQTINIEQIYQYSATKSMSSARYTEHLLTLLYQ